ncbi:MAG: histidine ammonia-lyase, partial [Bacillus sp. (in: firmicutes)]|nr:histidine ammonia-lyase [Bacillus sp. (in: firmicutes)]
MVELTGNSLTLQEISRVCFDGEIVTISAESMQKVAESRAAVEKIVSEKRTIYGINTGFGKFSDVMIDEQDVNDLQLNLIRSHACGVGEPFLEV